MSTLPEAGIGTEEALPPAGRFPVLLQRARALVGEKLSYALADQVTYSFGNMVVMALISRYCTHWQFGIYILTQRAMDVLIQLCNVFFWSPYTFNLPSAERREREYLGSIVAQQAAACVLGALLLWGASRWAATPARGQYYGVFAPLVLTSAGMLFREFTRRHYFAVMRFKAAFWTEVATVGLQVGGVYYLHLTGRLNVESTLWACAIGAIIVSFYWVVTEWKHFRVRARDAWDDLKLNMRLGRWLAGGNMVFLVSSQCNPWVLGGVLGPWAVGSYAVCESVVNIPRVALNSLQNVMAPVVARAFNDGGKSALRKVVGRYDRMLLAFSVAVAIGIAVAGPQVSTLIFKRPVNHLTLNLLALNFIAFAGTLAQSYGLTAIDRVRLTFYANVLGLAAQVLAAVWLVHSMQVPGAALAMLIGSVVVVFVRQIFYTREMREA